MNIVLCGMMGSGKTTVGLALEKISGRTRLDTDDVFVQRYGNISEVFASKGEPYFRALEREIIKELSKKADLILSTGGGVVLSEENRAALKNSGKIVYLRATTETLLSRLGGDQTRPLLRSETGSRATRIKELLKERAPIYESAADYIVDVDNKTPDEIAGEILGLING